MQLRRVKGYRKPEGAVNVARPSKWSNPHRISYDDAGGGFFYRVDHPDGTHSICQTPADAHRQAVDSFRSDLWCGRLPITIEQVQARLVGHDLACWCPPTMPCHADVLLELANQ